MTEPLVTLITPTGNRPEAFSLCEKYIARQSYKGPLQWIVVDDFNKSPTNCTMKQEYVKGPLQWKTGFNTQRYNFAAAIPLIKGDYIFIIEDDDYYKPEYLEIMLTFLKYADLVGEDRAVYYNLKLPGFKEMDNYKHASLCSTAFRKAYIPWFERAVHSGQTYMDLAVWSESYRHKSLLFSMRLVTGMKGVGTGRTGIGFGHHNVNEFIRDNDSYTKLKELIGPKDAQVYIDMTKK